MAHFELLVFISVLVIAAGTGNVLTSCFNILAGIPAAFLALVVFFKVLDFLRGVSARRHLRHRLEMVENLPARIE